MASPTGTRTLLPFPHHLPVANANPIPFFSPHAEDTVAMSSLH